MKSEQSSDEVAAAMCGFHTTENAVFDFIRQRRTSSQSDFIAPKLLGAISLKRRQNCLLFYFGCA